MKSVADLLRFADPFAAEPRGSASARLASREAILHAARPADVLPRRAAVPAMALAFALVLVIAGVLRWTPTAVDVAAAVRFEVRLAEDAPAAGLREAVVRGTDRKVYLHPEVVVANSDITRAAVVPGTAAATFHVTLAFGPDGAARMARATREHVGRPVAMLLDGEVAMAPTLRGPIAGAATLTGSFTRAEADRIVAGVVGQ